MREPIAYDVRSNRQPVFRRCGIDFTHTVQRVAADRLTLAQRRFLEASEPRDLAVVPVFDESEAEAIAGSGSRGDDGGGPSVPFTTTTVAVAVGPQEAGPDIMPPDPEPATTVDPPLKKKGKR